MYMNPFLVGVAATILVEFGLLIACGAWIAWQENRK